MTSSTQTSALPKTQQLGWVLLPLRVFFGVTFIYAGLLKFISADYLNSDSPTGVLKQMQGSVTHSPIGFILTHAIEHASLAGISIAAGELFAGLGILFGIWTRLAAVGAFVLSFSFLLTVSWGTYPYFFGSDIVFMAGVIPLMIAGDAGLFSVEAVIRNRVKLDLGIKSDSNISPAVEKAIGRRTLIQSGAVAGGLGVAGLVAGGIGRKMNHANPTALPTHSPTPTGSKSTQAPTGIKIATISDVPVGTAFQFTDASGGPAYLLQPATGTFLAYSAICTHEGCPVSYDHAANSFACPCHGAKFDATSGGVTSGPARSPLAKFNVVLSGKDIYLA